MSRMGARYVVIGSFLPARACPRDLPTTMGAERTSLFGVLRAQALFPSLPTLVLGSKSIRLSGFAANCRCYPGRRKSMILVPGGNVEWAVKEVKRLRNETWVAAVWPLLPEGKPIDHPDLAPLWDEMNDAYLPIV